MKRLLVVLVVAVALVVVVKVAAAEFMVPECKLVTEKMDTAALLVTQVWFCDNPDQPVPQVISDTWEQNGRYGWNWHVTIVECQGAKCYRNYVPVIAGGE